MWLGINLAAAATICYVVLAVHYHPRPTVQTTSLKLQSSDTSRSHNHNGHTRVNLREKLTSHKHRVISQLRQSLLQQKVSSKHFTLNQARFFGTRKLKDLTPAMILENLQNSLEKSHFQTLTSKSDVFTKEKHLLKDSHTFQQHFDSCAIVSSAGALLDSKLGSFIGNHFTETII